MTRKPSRRGAPSRSRYWLLKSEPGDYSIDDLAADGNELWDGIRNYQARNLMRDEMAVGDLFLFYHSSCAEPAVVGIGSITGLARPDPTQFDAKSKYYDPKSDPDNPRWLCVEVGYVRHARTPCTLKSMRADKRLADLPLLARGNRLSIQPVAARLWRLIEAQI